MIAIQTACSEQVVKGQDWNVDFSEGVILFGNQKYPLQFIGSEATSSNTWLWGWENVNGFSEKIIQVATHAKVVGGTLEFRATNDSRIYIGRYIQRA
ncbi:MAG: DUF6882 domain-containing protein [Coprococcus phoceensis]